MRAKFPDITREQFAMERFKSSDYRYCLVAKDSEPVAIFGVQFATKGVGTAWLIATDRLPEHAIEMMRFARRAVHGFLSEKIAHRMQGFVLAEYDFCRAFIERLGFVREATCIGMGAHGESIDIYAKLGV